MCDLQPLPSGRWFCRRCDPEKERTTPKRSHRECRVRLPAKEEARINALAAIARAVKTCMDWHLYHLRTPEEIEPLLAICLDCEDHPCTKQCTLLKRLACVEFSECERWE